MFGLNKFQSAITTSDSEDTQQLDAYRQEALEIEVQHHVDVELFKPSKRIFKFDDEPPVSGDGSFPSHSTETYMSDFSNQPELALAPNPSNEIADCHPDVDTQIESPHCDDAISDSVVESTNCSPCEPVETVCETTCEPPQLDENECESAVQTCEPDDKCEITHNELNDTHQESCQVESHDFNDICYTPNSCVCDTSCVEMPAVCHDVVEVEHHDDYVEHCDVGDHDSGHDAHDSDSSDGDSGGSSGDGHS